MSITTKPTGYTVDTGHAKCPDHLWMFDENTGSVSYDQGKSSSKVDITLYESGSASSNLWGSDALGTIITCRDATISSRYGLSGTLTWDATTSLLMVAIIKSTDTGGTTNEAIAGYGLSTTGNPPYGYLRGQPHISSYLDAYNDDFTGAYAHNGTSAVPVYTQAWVMAHGKFKAGELGVAIDNGAWQATANAGSWPSTGSSPNRYAVGAVADSSPSGFYNGSVLALFAYINDYTSWTDTWVDDLYADPWQFLTISSPTPPTLMGAACF